MASRDDITVNFELDPRLADVSLPSTEVTVQDSHDTLTDIQETSEGHQYPQLLVNAETTGGQSLSAGVTVGLTQNLENLQYAFGRTSPLSTGTVTSTSATQLIDSSATFQTDGAERGDWIINFTDQSVTEILQVVSETTLNVRALSGGTLNALTTGDSYKVWDVEQAKLDGGNFVATDENGTEILPFFTTFGRFISRTSASSATSTSQDALERGLYGGAVCFKPSSPYDINSTVDGRVGTRQFPLNNIQDCYTIALDLGLNVIEFLENCTVAGVDVSASPILFKGLSPQFVINFDPSANVSGCEVEFATVRGELDGLNIIRDCLLLDISAASGFFEKCSFIGPVSLGGPTNMYECYSSVTGTNSPQFFLGNFDLQVRDFHGSFGVCGKTGGDSSIEIYGGKLEVDATSTGGNIYLRGEYSVPPVIDPAAGTTVFDQSNTSRELRIAKAILANRVDISVDGQTIQIYDDDNTTVIYTQNVSADKRFRTVA